MRKHENYKILKRVKKKNASQRADMHRTAERTYKILANFQGNKILLFGVKMLKADYKHQDQKLRSISNF